MYLEPSRHCLCTPEGALRFPDYWRAQSRAPPGQSRGAGNSVDGRPDQISGERRTLRSGLPEQHDCQLADHFPIIFFLI
jgi:hypothetical protein